MFIYAGTESMHTLSKCQPMCLQPGLLGLDNGGSQHSGAKCDDAKCGEIVMLSSMKTEALLAFIIDELEMMGDSLALPLSLGLLDAHT